MRQKSLRNKENSAMDSGSIYAEFIRRLSVMFAMALRVVAKITTRFVKPLDRSPLWPAWFALRSGDFRLATQFQIIS